MEEKANALYQNVAGNAVGSLHRMLKAPPKDVCDDASQSDRAEVLFVKHNEDKTAVKHYLDKKELLEKMDGVRLYSGVL